MTILVIFIIYGGVIFMKLEKIFILENIYNTHKNVED